MKRSNLIGTISFIGFVSIILFSSKLLYGQDKTNNESTAQLSKRIEWLETLVKEQQKKIESLESDIEKIKKESPMVTLPSFPNNLRDLSNKLPKGTKPFTFNGQTYYMVPLNKLETEFGKLDKNKK